MSNSGLTIWVRRKSRGLRLKLRVWRLKARARIADPLYLRINRGDSYTFRLSRYAGSFVASDTKLDSGRGEIPRVLWCFWTGANEMSPTRRQCFDQIGALNDDLQVVLVTQANLEQYLVEGAPLHPSYDHLSYVHRADYLRCYFMHHWGGAYTDVKKPRTPWRPALERLEGNSEKWILGYREISSGLCAQLPGPLGRDLRRFHRSLVGMGAFAFRPDTSFTAEWTTELYRRMDRLAPALARSPGNERGTNPSYPVRWAELLGEIVQPLCLKYHERILFEDDVVPWLSNYQ